MPVHSIKKHKPNYAAVPTFCISKENPVRKLLMLLGFISRPLTAGGPTLSVMVQRLCGQKSAGVRREPIAI